jgi:hypothetical protein
MTNFDQIPENALSENLKPISPEEVNILLERLIASEKERIQKLHMIFLELSSSCGINKDSSDEEFNNLFTEITKIINKIGEAKNKIEILRSLYEEIKSMPIGLNMAKVLEMLKDHGIDIDEVDNYGDLGNNSGDSLPSDGVIGELDPHNYGK